MNMFIAVVAFALIVAVFLIVSLLKGKSNVSASAVSGKFKYEPSGPIMSASERAMFTTLERATNNRFKIVTRVKLGDLVKTGIAIKSSDIKQAQQALVNKTVDFVLADPFEFKVQCAVVLREEGAKPGEGTAGFIEAALKSAGIKAAGVTRSAGGYSIDSVKSALNAAGLSSTGAQQQRRQEYKEEIEEPEAEAEVKTLEVKAEARIERKKPEPAKQPQQPKPTPATASNGGMTCPECGSRMQRRKLRKGPNAGRIFWGCSRYPECKATIVIKPGYREAQGGGGPQAAAQEEDFADVADTMETANGGEAKEA